MIAASMSSGFAGIIAKRVSACCVLLCAAMLARGQQENFTLELTALAGFTTGGDFEESDTAAELSLDDSAHVGLILDIRQSSNTQWEILYSRQETKADVTGSPLGASTLELRVHYLQGGGTYLFDGENARPFIAATIGASHFAPGPSGVDSETFFSFSIGAGLQVLPINRFGIRLEARGFGTLLGSDSDLFCQSGPAGAACAIRAEGTVLWQAQAFAGFVFRF